MPLDLGADHSARASVAPPPFAGGIPRTGDPNPLQVGFTKWGGASS
jgi:hypothetical protein